MDAVSKKLISKEVSDSVSEKFGIEKVSDAVSEIFGIGKKSWIQFRSEFWYRHTLLASMGR